MIQKDGSSERVILPGFIEVIESMLANAKPVEKMPVFRAI